MVEIREEAPEDAEFVFQVHEAAFGSPEEAALVDSLRATVDPYISLVLSASTTRAKNSTVPFR